MKGCIECMFRRHGDLRRLRRLWGIATELTDPNTHPRASGDYDPWSRPDPRRDFILSLAFRAAAGQCGDAAAGERSAFAEPGWRTSRYGRARLGP